ncbi:unnamed protein product [Dicrocoelium dendriticum]|nr:unnamed protein product [Dicrocoelium dendriticum]
MAACKAKRSPSSKLRVRKKHKKQDHKKRPPGPYALFVQSKRHLYGGNIGNFARRCASEWRKLSEGERETYRKRAARNTKRKVMEPKSAAYLNFVNRTYRCLRSAHPEWSAKRVREQLIKNYHKLKCRCTHRR